MKDATQSVSPSPRIAEGPVPKHVQLRSILVGLIDEELAPGRMIPSERELMARFAVSRATVREAVGQLVVEGRLERVHGKGTFVSEPRVESQLHLASFTQDMRRRGHQPSTRLLDVVAGRPPEDVSDALGLSDGARAWRVERLRSADGRPMAHEIGWYAADALPNLDSHDLKGSLYHLLSEAYELTFTTATQTVRAEACDPDRAALLQVSPGAPLLVFERTSSTVRMAVEYTISWYRGDRYQVHMHLDTGRY